MASDMADVEWAGSPSYCPVCKIGKPKEALRMALSP